MLQNSYKSMYRPNFYESTCLRCNDTVYQVDRVGPLKDFTFFHSGCFKCATCGTKLTLKTYYNNQHRQEDKEVYCSSHVPKIGPGHLDGSSVGIRSALNVPKSSTFVNEQIRGPGRGAYDVEGLNIRTHLNGNSNLQSPPPGERNSSAQYSPNSYPQNNHSDSPGYQYGRFDASALHIAHALRQTEIQKAYRTHREKPIDCYLINQDFRVMFTCGDPLVSKWEQFFEKLSAIESRCKDQIFENLLQEDLNIDSKLAIQLLLLSTIFPPNTRISLEGRQWKPSIAECRDSFLVHIKDKDEQRRLEMKHRKEEDELYRKFARQREEEDRRIRDEFRDEWEKELERLTNRFEREMQIKKKRDEQNILTLRHQQEREDLEKNMTLRRDKKKESLTRKMLEHERAATAALVEKQSHEMLKLINEKRNEYMMAESLYVDDNEETGYTDELPPYPSHAPVPAPPALSKFQIYSDPIEFQAVDQIAISVAQEDQKSFTDLVRQLVGRCGSDIEKARTIFRWITVKNLNTMSFDENLRGDTPMGLLRGIKNGTESYHVLFKRLCSYAGLHCVVIKGYSKSAGYQPGVRFEDNRFRNSWNAVYVAGAWRFVQCNWGARHLVNAKEAPKAGNKTKSDSLRYEYDDHYFLTDPKEFIYEFFPLQQDWQLLKQPITLQEFEELPFVRSLFFRYGLYFSDPNTKAVMYTDSTGAATVRIAMPTHMQGSLIFHYNLKFYDSDGDNFENVSLKRFVMQSVVGNMVAFRVHAPCSGAFLLDIFANAVTPKEYLTGEPMKFKSVCKFKICCEDLQTVMVPLPDCASGEWGPTKATRLFGLVPITHQDALVFAGRELEVQFRMSRSLTDFMATLHKNGVEEKRLSKFVSHNVSDDIVTFNISFPEEGQYGLDIYTREMGAIHDSTGEKHLLTHCCKYLINSSKRN